MDVLGELIVRPRLDAKEIEGERTVIIEEIRSYQDDPAEYAQTLFQTALFGDGPLGVHESAGAHGTGDAASCENARTRPPLSTNVLIARALRTTSGSTLSRPTTRRSNPSSRPSDATLSNATPHAARSPAAVSSPVGTS